VYCRKCGTQQPEGAQYCSNCGYNLYDAGGDAIARYWEYAGFWRRFAASIIDGIILNVLSLGIGAVTGIGIFAANIDPDSPEITPWLFLYPLIMLAADVLYYGLFESSSVQATPGKMVLGIKVTDMNGARVSFPRAVGRYFGKIISGLILGIGYLMIAFTEKKQGLHDIMAGTLVVTK
jgi:uncharacterized RDD family membrane protein YckC